MRIDAIYRYPVKGLSPESLDSVAVETAIVMLLYLNLSWEKRRKRARAENRPLTRVDIEEAVYEGAVLRVRPRVMTVATIFAGLIPIMHGTGTGSEARNSFIFSPAIANWRGNR